MASPVSEPTPPAEGVELHSAQEIQGVLDSLLARDVQILSQLRDGLQFASRLRRLDPRTRTLVIEFCADSGANSALLARPRCRFHAEVEGAHVEFVAANPRQASDGGMAVIELDYPELLVVMQRRAQPRHPVPEHPPLRCVADAGGIAPFSALVVDVSAEGLCFIVYAPDITLEPGTRLCGCRIELADGRMAVADLEVRYTQPVPLGPEHSANRSGCRFIAPSPALLDLLRHYFGSATVTKPA